MFEEQARRNEELQAKVMELQTKLVVSSLPRGCSQNVMEKLDSNLETGKGMSKTKLEEWKVWKKEQEEKVNFTEVIK
ncbi:hypothetical protein E2C01_057938 [Portunus trituberculatus]|uniref:Uncharacterized protein n=1 Tax=Portunus trituberculatus TaxID=210409 RepID=A0A5B7GYB9_PORTR|nr:hypothetical protein [Portunus trituberculatus]